MKNDDENYVKLLTERIYLIKEKLEAGELKIAAHLWEGFRKSFDSIRLRDDGLVDPNTVDGRLRAMGAGLHGFEERKQLKEKFSIHQLQEAYFRILFNDFGEIYEMMVRADKSPHHVSQFLSTQSEFVNDVTNNANELYTLIKEFWDTAADIGIFHLQDGKQLKATFAGDLFPAYSENAVSIGGLYIDTIVLPCPILRIFPLKDHMRKEAFSALLMKHILTCMTYRDVILEEIETPIAMILPHVTDISLDKKRDLFDTTTPYLLKHIDNMFGVRLGGMEELEEYFSTLTTADAVLDALVKPNLLMFDTEWGRSAKEQLIHLLKKEHDVKISGDNTPVGLQVLYNLSGRFPQAYAAKENALTLGGVPFINAETSWIYYNWLLEYDSKTKEKDPGLIQSLHVSHALSIDNQSQISWLGNVPVKTVIELRRRDMMNEVRDLLSSGINELIANNENGYIETTNRVIDNIDNAFKRHQLFIKKAKKDKLKILGIDIGLMVVSGSIGLAAAYKGDPSLGVLSTGLGLYGFPNIKDIKSEWKEQKMRMDAYRNSPVGVLFNHIKV